MGFFLVAGGGGTKWRNICLDICVCLNKHKLLWFSMTSKYLQCFLIPLSSLSLSIVLTLHFLVYHRLFLPVPPATLFSFHKHFFFQMILMTEFFPSNAVWELLRGKYSHFFSTTGKLVALNSYSAWLPSFQMWLPWPILTFIRSV